MNEQQKIKLEELQLKQEREEKLVFFAESSTIKHCKPISHLTAFVRWRGLSSQPEMRLSL
jgi:hypothetical protein